jgi:hypothetical protein
VFCARSLRHYLLDQRLDTGFTNIVAIGGQFRTVEDGIF